MAEETAFGNGRISHFEGHVTLTLDWVILHTIMYHSLTSTYESNVIKIKETFCGWTDVRLHRRTLETGFIRSTLSKSQPKNFVKFGHVVV